MVQKPLRRPKKSKPPLAQRLRNDFLTGLVVVLPMFLTAYLLWWFVGFVDDKVVPLIPRRYDPENVFGRNIFGFALFTKLGQNLRAPLPRRVGRAAARTAPASTQSSPVCRLWRDCGHIQPGWLWRLVHGRALYDSSLGAHVTRRSVPCAAPSVRRAHSDYPWRSPAQRFMFSTDGIGPDCRR